MNERTEICGNFLITPLFSYVCINMRGGARKGKIGMKGENRKRKGSDF